VPLTRHTSPVGDRALTVVTAGRVAARPETGRACHGVLRSSDALRPLDPELRPGEPGVRPPSKGQRLTATPGAKGVAPDADFAASIINSYVVNRPDTQLNIS